MRISGGKFGSRRLQAPSGEATRPTSDRVREALFSVLVGRGLVHGARVLDVYAGTGALGLEALSRGADSAHFVERDAKALVCLRANVSELGVQGECKVHACALEAFLKRAEALSYSLIFADPPYALLREPTFQATWERLLGLLAPGGVAVLEHDKRDATPKASAADLLLSRNYGDTTIAIYVAHSPSGTS